MIRVFYSFKAIIRALIVPFLLIVAILIFLTLTVKSQDNSTKGAIYGLVFGVALGFGVDMFKRSFDDAAKQIKLENTIKKMLEQDARAVYRQAQQYSSLINSPQIPDEVKSQIPPEYKVRYWKRIKEDKDFLSLASDEWFHKIYTKFFDIDEINEQIGLAKEGNEQAYIFARTFYRLFIDEKDHIKLLEEFIGEKGIKKFQKEIENKAKKKNSKK